MKLIIFLLAGLFSVNVLAETVVSARDSDVEKAIARADLKAAELAVKKKRCVAYYSDYDRCKYHKQHGKWECKAGASKHAGSCGRGAWEQAVEDSKRLKAIVDGW